MRPMNKAAERVSVFDRVGHVRTYNTMAEDVEKWFKSMVKILITRLVEKNWVTDFLEGIVKE